MLAQITSPYFCAGLVFEQDSCVEAAPIIKYMVGWSRAKVRDYCHKKAWKAKVVSSSHNPEPAAVH